MAIYDILCEVKDVREADTGGSLGERTRREEQQ